MVNFILKGKVSKGLGKGKQLGFPTFNLETADKLVVDKITGVWSSFTYYKNKKLKSVTHIGQVKLFGVDDIRVETYILDWQGNLYSEDIKVELLEKIRDTKDFQAEDDLVKQMNNDVEQARNYFKNNEI